MMPFRFFYTYTKSQRTGIIALFILIFLIQAFYFVLTSFKWQDIEQVSADEEQWLALQQEIDELKLKNGNEGYTIYPFNPNFISDYKGYTLGMTTAEIDRLHKFRETGKYINSVKDFKEVTQVSDSLLNILLPYFKFPEWVSDTKNNKSENRVVIAGNANKAVVLQDNGKTVSDINTADAEQLEKVYGIGPVFAKRILKKRSQLGGFVSMEQMNDFKEFSPEAVDGLKKSFTVQAVPNVKKININSASLSQLNNFPYFNKDVGRAIITHRSMKGKIVNVEELLEINDFPVDKVKIITLYLEF